MQRCSGTTRISFCISRCRLARPLRSPAGRLLLIDDTRDTHNGLPGRHPSARPRFPRRALHGQARTSAPDNPHSRRGWPGQQHSDSRDRLHVDTPDTEASSCPLCVSPAHVGIRAVGNAIAAQRPCCHVRLRPVIGERPPAGNAHHGTGPSAWWRLMQIPKSHELAESQPPVGFWFVAQTESPPVLHVGWTC
jgi:hypothetical protein